MRRFSRFVTGICVTWAVSAATPLNADPFYHQPGIVLDAAAGHGLVYQYNADSDWHFGVAYHLNLEMGLMRLEPIRTGGIHLRRDVLRLWPGEAGNTRVFLGLQGAYGQERWKGTLRNSFREMDYLAVQRSASLTVGIEAQLSAWSSGALAFWLEIGYWYVSHNAPEGLNQKFDLNSRLGLGYAF